MELLFDKLLRIERRLFLVQKRNIVTSKRTGSIKNKQSVNLSYNSYEDTQIKVIKSPILILHGLFGCKNNWHSLAKIIAQRTERKVFTLDARNHGDSPHVPEHTYDSMRSDVCRFLDELNIKKCVLVGHSMGGKTAMNLALNEPSYIEKLVIVDISPFTSPSNMQMIKYAETMRTVKFPEGVPLSKARNKVNVLLQPVVQDDRVRQFLLSSLVDAGNNTFRWQFNIEVLCDNLPHILNPQTFTTKFDGPTLFIRGGNSDYIKQSDKNSIQEKLFPNATFQTVTGAGHFVHSEKPADFLNALCSFVNEDVDPK